MNDVHNCTEIRVLAHTKLVYSGYALDIVLNVAVIAGNGLLAVLLVKTPLVAVS